jgi:hypothetical protein
MSESGPLGDLGELDRDGSDDGRGLSPSEGCVQAAAGRRDVDVGASSLVK